MKLYNVIIPVYADNEQQAQETSDAMLQLVTDIKQQGRALTAEKLKEAVLKWKKDSWIRNETLKHLPKIAK